MRIKSLLRKNFIFIYSISTAFCLICTGCGSAKEAEDEAIIVVSGEEEGYAYTLETVKKGNVVLTKSLNCTYVQAKEQSVAFSESGKTIEKIYVREGDYVNKGDILAEVSLGTLEEDIAALEYEIAEMSGGEQQRVAIARAIAHRPRVIFADEPTAELDSAMAASVTELFKNMAAKEGITVLMTTHDVGLMDAADSIIELESGERINA